MQFMSLVLIDPQCGELVATIASSTVKDALDMFEQRLEEFGLGDMPMEEPGRKVEINVIGDVSERSPYLSCDRILAFDDDGWNGEEVVQDASSEKMSVVPPAATRNEAIRIALEVSGKSSIAEIADYLSTYYPDHAADNKIVGSALSRMCNRGDVKRDKKRKGVYSL